MEKKKIAVNIVNNVVGSQYTQIARCTLLDDAVLLEFVSVYPPNSEGKAEGAVVSRVVMPKLAAKELSEVIVITILEHETKNK